MTSQVNDFYNGKNIFLTGGTGFLGICLVEKLLRSCPDLKNIYLLIRPKKGKQINERLEELTQNSVFDRLKEENKIELFKKLIAIPGDVGEDNLGLSNEDRSKLIENVHIVVHSAATLDFEASLKNAVFINLLGTRRVIQLCQEIKNLKALVHVSSAYVNSVLQDVQEKIYPPPEDVNKVLKLVKELDDKALEDETPKLLGEHPNSYTFTKHLAEHEVANAHLPSAIVRPSMIVGSWKEPIPGWTISKNGPTGFLMGASKGIVRRLPIARSLIYDYIPVDVVVNTLITTAYAVNRDGGNNVKVYHCTSSTSNPFKWEDIEAKITPYLHKYPLKTAVWYPHLKILNSIFLFKISAFFVHMIPAFILDTITRLFGGRPILLRLHNNINKSIDRLERFIFTEWKFNNPLFMDLYKSLSEEDKDKFFINIESLVWEDYFLNLVLGVRIYLSNDPKKTLEKARSKNMILMMAHIGLQALLLGFCWWVVKVLFNSTWTKTGMAVPFIYLLFDQI
ncbi:putative fatty acyl-CoA reductase CG8306 [Vespula squamosa]|uniref:Fatty acyl-CoA reductase n=1 Tax=Vespula squamosa TaxID=30214 RepID=A0ABD2A5R7_VESSQ